MRPEQPLQEQDTTLWISEETHDARAAWAAGSEAHARSQQQEGVKRDVPASKSFQPLNPRFLPNHYTISITTIGKIGWVSPLSDL